MPKIFRIGGYVVFFWSNEGHPMEPVHVHVGKSVRSNATKIWIHKDGTNSIANNNSNIPDGDLRQIQRLLSDYSDEIVAKWEMFFNCDASFKE